jgi:hypothetical protein
LWGRSYLGITSNCPAHLLRKPIDPAVRRSIDRRILVAPTLSLLGIVVAMVQFQLASLVYLSIPVFYLRHWLADTGWQPDQ